MKLWVALLLACVPAALADSGMQSELGTGIAMTLVIGILYMMAMLYLFNFPDDDIKRYAYEIASNVISWFVAVVVFGVSSLCIQGFDSRAEWQLGSSAIQMLFWLVILQLQCTHRNTHTLFVSGCLSLAAVNMWCTLQRQKVVSMEMFQTSSVWFLLLAFVVQVLLYLVSNKLRGIRIGSEADEFEVR